MKQKFTKKVAGIEVSFVSDETPEYVEGLIDILDRKISDMIVGSMHCTKFEAAIICAADYLDGKLKAEKEIERLKEEIKKLDGSKK